MSEEKSENINTKSEGFNAGKPDEHFPEDKGAPDQPLQRSPYGQTLNIEPQTVSMEVHHHGHVHHQKKWKEYLFQFVMLFLAVFCGFFAEYQLEHKIERERAYQLKKELLNDLKADTAALNNVHQIRTWIIGRIDSLLNEMKKPATLINTRRVYELSFKVISIFNFKRADGTILQLKNSGYLRYFSGSAIPATLAQYDQDIIALANFEKTYGENLDRYAQEMIIEHFDANILNSSWADYVNGAPVPDSAPFYNIDQNRINRIRSRLVALKHLNIVCKGIVIGIKQKASELMQSL